MQSIFGLDKSSRLVHVDEVERGLACECRCVICGDPLVARQGEVREHHFAHASNREACPTEHESLLHRYAKRVIVEAGGLIVPINQPVAVALGLPTTDSLQILMSCQRIDEEVTMGSIRPDLLVVTDQGIGVAIEIAYSSFCNVDKRMQFEALQLPVVEIDLSSFTPEAFDPRQVKSAVIELLDTKTWLWPTEMPVNQIPTNPSIPSRLEEELIVISGRWISIKRLPSGDLTVKSVRFDPDLVSLVRSVARANHGKYQPSYKTWIIPRWRAPIAREQLRAAGKNMQIRMGYPPRPGLEPSA